MTDTFSMTYVGIFIVLFTKNSIEHIMWLLEPQTTNQTQCTFFFIPYQTLNMMDKNLYTISEVGYIVYNEKHTTQDKNTLDTVPIHWVSLGQIPLKHSQT